MMMSRLKSLRKGDMISSSMCRKSKRSRSRRKGRSSLGSRRRGDSSRLHFTQTNKFVQTHCMTG